MSDHVYCGFPFRKPVFSSSSQEERLIKPGYQDPQKMRNKKQQDRDLVNERIRFKEVLLIGPNGESMGVVPTRVALQKSLEMQLDLLCVSPQANPPVCRIVNYGKYKFEKEKKAKDMKKNQKNVEKKEVRFSATTDLHDLEIKAKATLKFLSDNMKVTARVFIKGRMRSRMDIVSEKMNQFLNLIKDQCVIEKEPTLDGKYYSVELAPKSNNKNKEGQKNA